MRVRVSGREIGETDLKKCEQINVKVFECEDSFMKKKVRVIPCAVVCVFMSMQICDCFGECVCLNACETESACTCE